jgi:hypothetical protein
VTRSARRRLELAERKQKRKPGKKRNSVKALGIIFMVIFMLGAFTLGHSLYVHKPEPALDATVGNITFTKEEMGSLVNSLLAAVAPADSNSYFPELIKQKIVQIYTAKNAGTLAVELALPGPYSVGKRMYSGYDSTRIRKMLGINGSGIMVWIRLTEHTPTGFTRSQKNSFALGLTHEGVHLDSFPDFTTISKWTHDQVVDEEVRTYFKVNMLAVRPLLAKGEPVTRSFVVIDSIIKSCGDTPCTALRKWVAQVGVEKTDK